MAQLIPSNTPLREFKDHKGTIWAVAVFLDRQRMVTGSLDKTVCLWNLETGVVLKKMEGHGDMVMSLAVSQDGKLVASGDYSGEFIIWHGETGEPLTQPIKAHSHMGLLNFSPEGAVLATCGDKMVKLWSTKTWEIQGDPIICSDYVHCFRYSPSGELLAIATFSNIEIHNLGTRECVTKLKLKAHTPYWHNSLRWTPDGTRLLLGDSATIREWDTSTWKEVGDGWMGHTDTINAIAINPAGTLVASASDDKHILPINMSSSIRDACIAGDLSTAEMLLTQEIDTDADDYHAYANRSIAMARQHQCDHALQDAIKSISIKPSLMGYISKGIALSEQRAVLRLDASVRHGVHARYMFITYSPLHFSFQAIAIFDTGHHEEAFLRVRELASACPNNDTLTCRAIEAYLSIQLGISASDGARYEGAAGHFAAAVNFSAFSTIPTIYDDLVVLFGWDLESMWLTASQKLCQASLSAGKVKEALEAHQSMMDTIHETTKAGCLDWSNGNSECYVPYLADGDAALAAGDYDTAIDLYSVAIDLNSANDAIFANRSEAKLGENAMGGCTSRCAKVNPSSHVGYQLKHAALRGAQRYDEAIETFNIMLSKLDDAPDAQMRELRAQYVSPSEVDDAIRNAIWIELENTPLRLLNTSTGLLCDRTAQINAFKMSAEYKELLSFTTKHSDLRMNRINEVVAKYFRCVLLSHRWEETELLLHNIQDKVVYELNPVGGIVKLQSFCRTARDAGYFWAWMDTCCIDKNNNTEVQESINSMFIWYRHSALTIVYLSDVPPLSMSGALARSAWNKRGWTFQEFVAPQVVLFYTKDWTLYLDDHSPNHKESTAIMEELEGATGMDRQALVAFRPGMSGVREKLRRASSRRTTLQEDIAYSLFGIFGVQLPVIYGEKKQNALGRLLQDIVARSGDITALDWVGKSSEFNSCLPADITSYAALPCALPSLSEDEIQTMVSSLRDTVAAGLASKLYTKLQNMSAPRFANCRLHLPCIVFRVTEADGLRDLLITTDDKIIQFSRGKPTQQTFFLVRPWDRRLLELPDFEEQPTIADDVESLGEWLEPESPLDDSPGSSPVEQELVDSESSERASRLIVRLGQPFGAFLLAQLRIGEYKRIAPDHNIIAQVKDVASVRSMMNVRTLEIL
ncbi:uncharacterized protein EDB91DRAFT_1249063 [Suillus paluster]|uniref:uncharacterized protein n=1 Tax=Suillus paluster TaxID=48578 RepID=UPI001B85CB4B|nr:uncharacterized protein EDB91DRAFT_1249063 [Suillus paluster]KAG1738890.1 hypothetical protein EDB91DRAFT_1249063 [Suillus paluster]